MNCVTDSDIILTLTLMLEKKTEMWIREGIMIMSKITIKNYQLFVNSELNVDSDIALLVGRNNTAKTSCMNLIEKVRV